ncbi:MAG: MerR family transcriptional regulator [Clostridia bacterium]|nr:MerR family transcriptional regulator [Clostridia bacterium]
MQYLIGEVARAMGLTPAALHFYERVGVSEVRISNKTRRQYSVKDVLRLASYRKYRSMELPMKEIARQFADEEGSFEEIGERLGQQAVLTLEMVEKYKQLHEDISWFQKAIARSVGRIEHVDVAGIPESYVLSCGADGVISHSKEEQTYLSQWLEQMPATRISEICNPDGSARFAYSIDLHRGEDLGLDQTPGVFAIASKPALHTYISRPRKFSEQPDVTFSLLRTYLEEHGFTQDGIGLGIDLCVSRAGSERNTLCEVWLPIK